MTKLDSLLYQIFSAALLNVIEAKQYVSVKPTVLPTQNPDQGIVALTRDNGLARTFNTTALTDAVCNGNEITVKDRNGEDIVILLFKAVKQAVNNDWTN